MRQTQSEIVNLCSTGESSIYKLANALQHAGQQAGNILVSVLWFK
jgi:hypothetical protein